MLAKGQNELQIPFVWTADNGVTIKRTLTVSRNEYAVRFKDEVSNTGTAPRSYVLALALRPDGLLGRAAVNKV